MAAVHLEGDALGGEPEAIAAAKAPTGAAVTVGMSNGVHRAPAEGDTDSNAEIAAQAQAEEAAKLAKVAALDEKQKQKSWETEKFKMHTATDDLVIVHTRTGGSQLQCLTGIGWSKWFDSVQMLRILPQESRQKLAPLMKMVSFEAGEPIIEQGDVGSCMYFMEHGAAVAEVDGEAVMTYSQGDYFGELALLNNSPRAATVRGLADTRCMVLDRDAFYLIADAAGEDTAMRLKEYETRGGGPLWSRNKADKKRVDGALWETAKNIKKSQLHRAAEQGKYHTVKRLLAAGEAPAQVRRRAGDEKLALHFAAQHGHGGVVQLLLAVGDDSDTRMQVLARDGNQKIALHIATELGHDCIVRQLLAAADAEEQTLCTLGPQQAIPLRIAIDKEHASTVQALLESNACSAQLCAHNNGGTMLQAVFRRYPKVARNSLLMLSNTGQAPLHVAAARGLVDSVQGLLAAEAWSQLLLKDNEGRTPLRLAATSGHTRAACVLLSAGNDKLHDALKHAAQGHKRCIDALCNDMARCAFEHCAKLFGANNTLVSDITKSLHQRQGSLRMSSSLMSSSSGHVAALGTLAALLRDHSYENGARLPSSVLASRCLAHAAVWMALEPADEVGGSQEAREELVRLLLYPSGVTAHLVNTNYAADMLFVHCGDGLIKRLEECESGATEVTEDQTEGMLPLLSALVLVLGTCADVISTSEHATRCLGHAMVWLVLLRGTEISHNREWREVLSELQHILLAPDACAAHLVTVNYVLLQGPFAGYSAVQVLQRRLTRVLLPGGRQCTLSTPAIDDCDLDKVQSMLYLHSLLPDPNLAAVSVKTNSASNVTDVLANFSTPVQIVFTLALHYYDIYTDLTVAYSFLRSGNPRLFGFSLFLLTLSGVLVCVLEYILSGGWKGSLVARHTRRMSKQSVTSDSEQHQTGTRWAVLKILSKAVIRFKRNMASATEGAPITATVQSSAAMHRADLSFTIKCVLNMLQLRMLCESSRALYHWLRERRGVHDGVNQAKAAEGFFEALPQAMVQLFVLLCAKSSVMIVCADDQLALQRSLCLSFLSTSMSIALLARSLRTPRRAAFMLFVTASVFYRVLTVCAFAVTLKLAFLDEAREPLCPLPAVEQWNDTGAMATFRNATCSRSTTEFQFVYVAQSSATRPCRRILQHWECTAAADMLGLSGLPAVHDRQFGVDHDPPNCYFEGGVLKYNPGGNTGACSDKDVCLCKQPVVAVPHCACYCDSEMEAFTVQSWMLLLGYMVLSFFSTVACLYTSQMQLTKLRSLRVWVFSVLTWLLPVRFNSFSNMAQSRPDFPDMPLFWLRTIENVVLGVVIYWYEPIAGIRPSLVGFPLGTIVLYFTRFLPAVRTRARTSERAWIIDSRPLEEHVHEARQDSPSVFVSKTQHGVTQNADREDIEDCSPPHNATKARVPAPAILIVCEALHFLSHCPPVWPRRA